MDKHLANRIWSLIKPEHELSLKPEDTKLNKMTNFWAHNQNFVNECNITSTNTFQNSYIIEEGVMY